MYFCLFVDALMTMKSYIDLHVIYFKTLMEKLYYVIKYLVQVTASIIFTDQKLINYTPWPVHNICLLQLVMKSGP